MYEYLRGKLAHSTPQKATVDVSGVGYCLHISIATFQKLPKIGEEVKLYTSFVVREDSQRLFGFLTLDERDFFETLNDISGIGPRISISILGHMTLSDLHLAVEHADTKAITKIPGIGKKMAERLVLELRDKFQKGGREKIALTSQEAKGVVGDAIGALVNLGYKAPDAHKAVSKILSERDEEPPLAELISLALKTRNL